jgi:chaperone modulatory protein CbpM
VQATGWRFTSIDLARARHLREIESVFDANAELAALVVDLSEEVARLRRRLHVLGVD